MSQVSVTIDGRKYRLACNEGEEARLKSLAGMIDDKIGEMRSSFGEIGDQRLVIMAALTIADNLTEARDAGDGRAQALRRRRAARPSHGIDASMNSVRGSNPLARASRAKRTLDPAVLRAVRLGPTVRKSDDQASLAVPPRHALLSNSLAQRVGLRRLRARHAGIYPRHENDLLLRRRFGPRRERRPRSMTRSLSPRASRSRSTVS